MPHFCSLYSSASIDTVKEVSDVNEYCVQFYFIIFDIFLEENVQNHYVIISLSLLHKHNGFSKVFTSHALSPGVGTPSMVGKFHGDDPHFWDFQSDWVFISFLSMIQLKYWFVSIAITFISRDTRS